MREWANERHAASRTGAKSEVITAAILVIGDEILSGRTKDKNIGYIAEYLTNIGIDMREVRVVPDIEEEVVAALDALRHRYTYVFTTGGIGPTHDDITADCVAKAFGVTIDVDPRAQGAAAHAHRREGHERGAAAHGAHPGGRRSHPQQGVGGAGLSHRQRACDGRRADHHAGDARRGGADLKTGVKMLSETVRANCREGDIGGPLGEIAKAHPDVMIGSYPFQDEGRPNTNIVVRSRDPQKLAAAKAAVEDMLAQRARQPAADRVSTRVSADGGRAWRQPQALPDKAFPVSWDQFHRDARALAWRLAASGPFTAIVAITRGGLVPAAIVARELNVRLIETVCVESYHDYTKQGELRVLKGVAESIVKLGGKGVLIVDDLVDTGKTAKVVRELLPGAHFATVYAKPMGRPLVDTFITEVSQDTWIYFPWDTGLAFVPPIREGGA